MERAAHGEPEQANALCDDLSAAGIVAAADRHARLADGVRRMSTVKPAGKHADATPVDDVRIVREKLSRETDNDVNHLADRAREVAEQLRQKLGLRPDKDD